ncbi:hypothetical protein OHD16_21445 [Sphingobacterium sp. ML3W]|uniref:hypothetical protein n=1 Tax=Sphingobacterium sp. ML3W TaxID=1538644 RepID=UPI00249A69A1|nr:hypothetical protein [Sphingobacterium sp. ML3W]WFA77297.1 hypothetical protein OGI71_14585 [Sphingobacterium sp. ML3W]
MVNNVLILKTDNDQSVTLLKSEMVDFFNHVEDLDIQGKEDIIIELEDIVDDIVTTYGDENLAKGLKKRIKLMRLLVDFFRTVEIK